MAKSQQYALLDQAVRWLCGGQKWLNLAGCHRWPAAPQPGKLPGIGLHGDSETGSGHFSGLQTCQSSWVCPVCAAAKAEVDRQEIRQAIDLHRTNGGSLLRVTLTTSHHYQPLNDMYSRFGKARRFLLHNGPFRRVRAAVGCLGLIEANELTWSKPHGWHVHSHILLFMQEYMNDTDYQAIRRFFAGAWPVALAKYGLTCSANNGSDVRDADMVSSEYLTKFGRLRQYDVDDMLTDVDRRHTTSLSCWDLLRLGSPTVELGASTTIDTILPPAPTPFDPRLAPSSTVDTQDAARLLFQEYAACTAGRHHLRWSQGLREKLGLQGAKEEEQEGATTDVLREEEEQPEVAKPGKGKIMWCFGVLPVDQWRIVLANDCRAELLAVLGTCDYEQIAAFLVSIGVTWVPEKPYLMPLPVSRRSVK